MGVRATIWHDTFSLPLVSGVVKGKEFNLRRYLGGCFFVNSHGVVATCKHGDDIELVPRLLKGYVMRHWPQAPDWGALEALSVCELSFSIPEGYSGCPVLYQNERKRAVQLFGMAYGNLGSHITRHYEETVTEAGTTCVTTQDRIIEFGVAHTASDIQQAASDLGVTDLFE
jgi:hypothetical protein